MAIFCVLPKIKAGGMRKRVKGGVSVPNVVVQWLSQSKLKNEVPFFNVWLDGTGHVDSSTGDNLSKEGKLTD